MPRWARYTVYTTKSRIYSFGAITQWICNYSFFFSDDQNRPHDISYKYPTKCHIMRPTHLQLSASICRDNGSKVTPGKLKKITDFLHRSFMHFPRFQEVLFSYHTHITYHSSRSRKTYTPQRGGIHEYVRMPII